MAQNVEDRPLALGGLTRHGDILMAVGVIAILGVMVIPLPAILLDLLLAFSITTALVILLVAMYTVKPLQFSVFPGLLLVVTLFRLSLNVASTRLILGDAYAGKIIQAFGSFVVKGNYVVGFVIFLILIIINFVVITKGAGRVAEVAARFTLDAMPGKQMSIDADLNAGLIDEREARRRREEISREADFYGAMDGASKFVRGDAIAGLIITLLNIFGGFVIGVLQRKMGFSESLQTYTLLTVGDGLVSQIPALVISTSAGIIVTRAASESNLGRDLAVQILSEPRAIVIAAGVLVFLGITPGMPVVPFFALAIAAGTVAYKVKNAQKAAEELESPEIPPGEGPEEENIEDYLQVDTLELEIGYSLIPLVDAQQGGDLLSRITHIRRECALELGVLIPPLRIRDNIQLKPNEYLVKIRGDEVGRGELMVGRYMALNPGTAEDELPGTKATEPAFGLEAIWILESERERAELAGYTVVEAPAVLCTHLAEMLKVHAHQILCREDVRRLLDNVKKEQPTLVEELVPDLLTVGSIEKVLKNLLRERVPIRDMITILETLADYTLMTKDPDLLTEYVRNALSRTLSKPYYDENGTIRAITLDPEVEQTLTNILKQLRGSAESVGENSNLPIPPEVFRNLCDSLSSEAEKMTLEGRPPLVLCSPTVRPYFKKLIDPILPGLAVLSYNEIPPNVGLQSVGKVRLKNAD